jgi:hypothetical protein
MIDKLLDGVGKQRMILSVFSQPRTDWAGVEEEAAGLLEFEFPAKYDFADTSTGS